MLTLLECFGNWHPPASPHEQLLRAQVVVAHEFGDQVSVSETTREIVERAAELARRYELPLICQFPGDDVARELKLEPVHVTRENLRNPGAYLDTEEVNRQVAEFCKQHGWQRAILVTHPHHLWRASRNLSRHGMTVFLPRTEDIGYDPLCSRWALESQANFVPREIIARLMYVALRRL